MYKSLATAGAISLALNSLALAQTTSKEEVIELGTVLVTEGHTSVAAEKSGRAVTVITGKELEARQVRHVADALREVPGFAVSRTGSYGGLTQVRVRGAEGNHLLVLIDGIEASETSGGEFDFGGLLVDDIDRIEVLRGPQSAFWGSNAMAGVVNIITRRGARDGFRIGGGKEVGTDGTVMGRARLSGGGENYDASLSAVFRKSDGFNISRFGSESDGDRNATVNGKVTLDLTPQLTVDGTFRYVDRLSDLDPQVYVGPFAGYVMDGPDQTATRELFGSLGATHTALDGALVQRARLSGSDTFRENFTAPGVLGSSNLGSRLNGSYQATYEIVGDATVHKFTGGYEWKRETFKPSHFAQTFNRTTSSFIAEYRGEYLDQFFISAALRHDINDRFASATTYSLSGAWKIPGTGTRLHASIGTGITNPTFFEQFGYVPATFLGNPGLLPETSLGFDIGVEQEFFDGKFVADLTYFNETLENEIATVFGGAPRFLSSPVNRNGTSLRQGVEFAAKVNLFNGFTARATYTYTDSSEQTVAGGPRLEEVRRPKHTASFGAAYAFLDGKASVFSDVVINGEMLDNAFVPGLPSRVTLPAYTVVNVGGSYRFHEKLEAYARVENLFDARYEEVFTYRAPGRSAFFGLRGEF